MFLWLYMWAARIIRIPCLSQPLKRSSMSVLLHAAGGYISGANMVARGTAFHCPSHSHLHSHLENRSRKHVRLPPVQSTTHLGNDGTAPTVLNDHRPAVAFIAGCVVADVSGCLCALVHSVVIPVHSVVNTVSGPSKQSTRFGWAVSIPPPAGNEFEAPRAKYQVQVDDLVCTQRPSAQQRSLRAAASQQLGMLLLNRVYSNRFC